MEKSAMEVHYYILHSGDFIPRNNSVLKLMGYMQARFYHLTDIN